MPIKRPDGSWVIQVTEDDLEGIIYLSEQLWDLVAASEPGVVQSDHTITAWDASFHARLKARWKIEPSEKGPGAGALYATANVLGYRFITQNLRKFTPKSNTHRITDEALQGNRLRITWIRRPDSRMLTAKVETLETETEVIHNIIRLGQGLNDPEQVVHNRVEPKKTKKKAS